MEKLTAVEVSKGWKKTKEKLVVGAIFLSLTIIMATAFKTSDGVVSTNGVIGMIALVWAILTCYFYLTAICGLICYWKTGRLINRWVKVASEPIENFPMSSIERAGLQAWAREELEKRARAYVAVMRSVEENRRSYRDALAAAFPSTDIEPRGVPKLAQQVADWEANHYNLKQSLERLKRAETRIRSEYDAWWNLLRDLSVCQDGVCLLPDKGGIHFKNPASFSKWIKDEDARKERKQAEVVGCQQLAPPPPSPPQLVPQLVADRGVGGKK